MLAKITSKTIFLCGFKSVKNLKSNPFSSLPFSKSIVGKNIKNTPLHQLKKSDTFIFLSPKAGSLIKTNFFETL